MNRAELKKNFHLLIDSIENEKLLVDFYELLKNRSSSEEGRLWNNLTLQEQEEVLLTLKECDDPQNTISNEEMKKEYGKLLEH